MYVLSESLDAKQTLMSNLLHGLPQAFWSDRRCDTRGIVAGHVLSIRSPEWTSIFDSRRHWLYQWTHMADTPFDRRIVSRLTTSPALRIGFTVVSRSKAIHAMLASNSARSEARSASLTNSAEHDWVRIRTWHAPTVGTTRHPRGGHAGLWLCMSDRIALSTDSSVGNAARTSGAGEREIVTAR